MNILFFDTETTGLPNFKASSSDPAQPAILQLAAILCNGNRVLHAINILIQPGDVPIHPKALETHGISADVANSYGYQPDIALDIFMSMVEKSDLLCGHGVAFDKKLITIAAYRAFEDYEMAQDYNAIVKDKESFCTMIASTKYCALPYPSGRAGNKWPKLVELHEKLFGTGFDAAHDAMADIQATRRCYYELKKLGVI